MGAGGMTGQGRTAGRPVQALALAAQLEETVGWADHRPSGWVGVG